MKYSSLFCLLMAMVANPIAAEEVVDNSLEDEFAYLLDLPEPEMNRWQGFLNYSWNQEQNDYATASALLGWQHDQDHNRYVLFDAGSDESSDLLQASLRGSEHIGKPWLTLRGVAAYSDNREGGYFTSARLTIEREATALMDLDLLVNVGHQPLQLILGVGRFDQTMDYTLRMLVTDDLLSDQLDLQTNYSRFGFKWDQNTEKSMVSAETVLLYSLDDLEIPPFYLEGGASIRRDFINQLQLLKWQVNAAFYGKDYYESGGMLSVLLRGQWPLKEGLLPYWWESVGGPGAVSGYGTADLDTEKLFFLKLEQRWIKAHWQPFMSASGAWFDLAIPLQETDRLSYKSDSFALGLGAGVSWLPDSHFRFDFEVGVALLTINQAITVTTLRGFTATGVTSLAEAGDTSLSLQFYYYF